MSILYDGDDPFVGLKAKVSAVPLGLIAIQVLWFWIFPPEEEALLHRHWCRFSMLAFLLLLWLSISVNLPKRVESSVSHILLRFVPALDVTPMLKWILVALYVAPALCILGRGVISLVLYNIDPDVYNLSLPFEFSYSIPLLGTIIEGQDSFFCILGPKNAEATWSTIISLIFGMGVLLISMLLVSIPAKLMTGHSAASSILIRILVGVAMFIYSVIVSSWLPTLLDTQIYSVEHMKEFFLRMDRSGGAFMKLSYLMLAVCGAISCTSLVWSMTVLFLLVILIFIPSFLFPSFIDFLNIVATPLIIISVCAAFLVQSWTMVPKDE